MEEVDCERINRAQNEPDSYKKNENKIKNEQEKKERDITSIHHPRMFCKNMFSLTCVLLLLDTPVALSLTWCIGQHRLVHPHGPGPRSPCFFLLPSLPSLFFHCSA
jgi:hypothetical protein